MAVTDVLLTTLVTVALGLLVTRRYELAGLVIGAATAAKWPGALVLVPLAVAAWGQWRRLAYAGGLALAGFVVASPFAVVHLGEAASDLLARASRARGTARSAPTTTRSRPSRSRATCGTRSARRS